MDLYDELKMKDARKALEQQVLVWKDTTTRSVFNCPGYEANKNLFAFLTKDGVVLTFLRPEEQQSLAQRGAKPFVIGSRMVDGWFTLPVQSTEDVQQISYLIKKSYMNASNAPKGIA